MANPAIGVERGMGMGRACVAVVVGMLLGVWVPVVGQEPAAPVKDAVPAGGAASPEGSEAPTAPPVPGVIIPVTGTISDVTMESIQRRVERAVADGARVIIFELDTPGGYVDSALDICDYIKNLTHVKTVAWVHSQAYSAGSMIAVACHEIVMSAASTLGDCGVILGSPLGPQAVPQDLKAKAESPVLEQFRDSAARNGYNRLLSEALVRSELEVWWLENAETGEREFVDRETKRKRLDETGDSKRSVFGLNLPSLGQGKPPQWKLVETCPDPVSKTELPVHQPVVSDHELLTMSQSRAYAFGFCKAIVSNEAELVARYGLVGTPVRLDFTWSERLVGWLTSMPVRGFLLVLILLGAYVQFHTPGVVLPGLVALICLAIFLGAPYLTGLANVWEIVLVLIGLLLLLALEIFVIPGFGVAGISGIVLMLIGLLATFIPEEPGRSFPLYWPEWAAGMEGLKAGLITLACALTTSLAGMVLLSRFLPQMPYFRRIVPENPTPSAVMPEDPYFGLARVGDLGVCETPLRPAGKARFGSLLVDVVSEGEFLEDGAKVEVVERYGNRVVVRRA
ncbi:MAG: NfeD family protein [Planctomycetota bacterium]